MLHYQSNTILLSSLERIAAKMRANSFAFQWKNYVIMTEFQFKIGGEKNVICAQFVPQVILNDSKQN